MFVNIAMEMLDITITVIAGVTLREFPLEESMCVYACMCLYVRESVEEMQAEMGEISVWW